MYTIFVLVVLIFFSCIVVKNKVLPRIRERKKIDSEAVHQERVHQESSGNRIHVFVFSPHDDEDVRDLGRRIESQLDLEFMELSSRGCIYTVKFMSIGECIVVLILYWIPEDRVWSRQ